MFKAQKGSKDIVKTRMRRDTLVNGGGDGVVFIFFAHKNIFVASEN